MPAVIACNDVDLAVVGDGSSGSSVAARWHGGACDPGIGNRIIDVDAVQIAFVRESAGPCPNDINQAVEFDCLKVMHFNRCIGSSGPEVGSGVVYLNRARTAAPTDEVVFVPCLDVGIFMA